MDSLTYSVFICIVVALGMMLPILERKTRELILFMIIGVSCCLFISEVNNIILEAFHGDYFYVTTTLTPVTEEIIKALPILYYAMLKKINRRTLVANAFALGVGFALLENIFYILQSIDGVTILWALFRAFGSGLVHALCSVMVGHGISFIRMRRKLFVSGTFSLLLISITYHATFNLLTLSRFHYLAILLPILTYIPLTLLLLNEMRSSKKRRNKYAS